MSPGFQKAGAPSYASTLRGGAPPHNSNKAGRPGGDAPHMLPSAVQKKKYDTSSMPVNAGNNPLSKPSTLGPYSQAHTKAPKTGAVDSRRPDITYFEDASATNGGARTNSNSKSYNQQNVVDSLKHLSVESNQNSGSVVMGRAGNWERPSSMASAKSKVSKHPPRSDRSYPKPASSEYSVSYKRTHDQPPMEQAGFRQYAPFTREEFKIGAIVRRNVHEPDFKGPALPAFAPGSQASQTSTLVSQGGKGSKEHRSAGDFGPIYSEDRIFIVVSLCKLTYYALPLYTHDQKGLAHIAEKEDWVSVQDHRKPDSWRQHSAHTPLRTIVMNPDAKILDPLSTAWLPYAVPIRYSVPVAYQGRLDDASAKRARDLFLQYLGGEK